MARPDRVHAASDHLSASAIPHLDIAENLHRREITALERSELQAAWVEIVQARKKDEADKPAELRQVSVKGGRGKTSGMSQVARDLGIPRSTLQQSVKIAKLSPEAKAEARKLKLDDNQDALLEATKAKTPEAQTAAIERRAQQHEPARNRRADRPGG